MSNKINDILAHNLIVRVSEVLYKRDYQGLADFGAPEDEYDSEAKKIVKRIMLEPTVEDLNETAHIISDTFNGMFSDGDMDHVTSAELIMTAAEVQQAITLCCAEHSAAMATRVRNEH